MTRRRALLVLLLLLPLVPLSNCVRLGGVSAVPPRVHPGWGTLISGRYQEWFETYFGRHFGAFAPLVKIDSALDNLIGETRFNTGLCGLRGRHGVLFQNDEIDFANRAEFDSSAINARVDEVARMQRALAARGVAFRLLFVPTKLSYHAADLPARWRVPRPGPSAADRVTEATLARLRTKGVDVLDARGVVADVTTRTGEPGFPREGRHFTEFVGCHLLGRLGPRPYTCPEGERRPARGAENDLYRCFNEFGLTHAPEMLLDTSLTVAPSGYRRVLFVGSSFLRELETEARRLDAFEDLHLFYYNTSHVVGERELPMPKGDAWRDFVAGRDLIVMDWFAPQVEQLGHGFAAAVIRAFAGKDER